MKRRMKADTTNILWNDDYEEYQCEKCGAFFLYNFDFRYCPYCSRIVERSEERKTKVMFGSNGGVIAR